MPIAIATVNCQSKVRTRGGRSRFRLTINHMESGLAENDSRTLPSHHQRGNSTRSVQESGLSQAVILPANAYNLRAQHPPTGKLKWLETNN